MNRSGYEDCLIGPAIVYIVLGLQLAAAQTKIDLSAQSKNVDFSAATSTKPVQVGVALPPTCGQAQMFFLISAYPGQNLYLCTAQNIWTQVSSSVAAGTTGPLNFIAGFGTLLFTSTGGGVTNLQINVDTSSVLSRAAAQSGISNFCKSTTGTANYGCALSPTLSTYTGPSSSPPGSTCLVLYVDTANTNTATLNVDTLGAMPILGRAGGALGPGDIPVKQPVGVCFNDTAFLLQR